jgi:hypothetical protein
MIYSYTQTSQYLACPRRYRHRYLDGWQEKDTRAAMLFGRAFEQALAAYFRREDAGVSLYREWSQYQKQPLHFSDRDSWDSMLQQGIELLERFSQDDRIKIRQPRRNLQIKFVRPLAGENNDFVAYMDAIGRLDGRPCLLEWKTTSSRYPEEPEGLLALDPQLVCCSWITGIHDVAETDRALHLPRCGHRASLSQIPQWAGAVSHITLLLNRRQFGLRRKATRSFASRYWGAMAGGASSAARCRTLKSTTIAACQEKVQSRT